MKHVIFSGYGQIVVGGYIPTSSIKSQFLTNVKYPNFSVATISRKEDIIPALRKLLRKEKGLME